jgi:uncharacterized protein
MLLVKTKIAPSQIDGIGLFADQFIPKGTITWRAVYPFDIKVSREDILKLPDVAKEIFLKYSYFSRYSQKYFLCFDNDRFINHSEDPNIIEGRVVAAGEEAVSVAGRNIYLGEELTCDYRTFDLVYLNKLDQSASLTEAFR